MGGRTGDIRMIGVPVMAEETRSAAVCASPAGEVRVVVAARGFLLSVNPATGRCEQHPFPGGLVDYPFASLSTGEGMFHTGAGRQWMVFDPFAGSYRHAIVPAPEEEIVGMSFAEDGQGFVYATTYPGCRLLRFDPRGGRVEALGRLDKRQKYAMSLAVDRHSWVYAGIGTERPSIAAWDPKRRTIGTLAEQPDGAAGSAQVHTGADGEAYGRLREGAPWFRLRNGEMIPVDEADVSPSLYTGSGYNKLHRQLPGDERIAEVNLSDRELTLEAAGTGTAAGKNRRTIALRYETEGTMLSPLALGPDGLIYGTSNHPLHFYTYDPRTGDLRNYGGRAVEYGGGGNICAYAAVGPYLAGAAYAGGHIHVLDTRRPVTAGAEEGSPRNPVRAGSYPDIHRPRAAAAHPGGEYAVFGGFPGYGCVGGGLCLFHVPSMSGTVMTHQEVVPYQSTMGLAFMDEHRLFGCTSIETPGGAEPLADQAELYLLDWRSRKVVRRWTPVPGAREISLLAADRRGLLHAVTGDAVYFAFDPEAERVVRRLDLSRWGKPVRQGLLTMADGDGEERVYGLLSGAVFRISAADGRLDILAEPELPITAGMAITGGNLFFASGSRLASLCLT